MKNTGQNIASKAGPQSSLYAQNLGSCGFECQHCGYHHLLSDIIAGIRIMDLFRDGSSARAIRCPECDKAGSFEPKDLKFFGLRQDD